MLFFCHSESFSVIVERLQSTKFMKSFSLSHLKYTSLVQISKNILRIQHSQFKMSKIILERHSFKIDILSDFVFIFIKIYSVNGTVLVDCSE